MQQFLISWPPSTNSLWRAYQGRNILSRKARLWANEASKELLAQGARPIQGPVEVEIELGPPTRRSFDPDNRTKALFDLLVKNYIIEDDNASIVRRYSVTVGKGFVGARITVIEVDNGQEQNTPASAG